MQTASHELLLLFRTLSSDRPALTTVLALGLVVMSLIIAFAVTSGMAGSSLATIVNREIGLGTDKSLSEQVNYGISFLASVMFFLTFVQTRIRLYLFLTLLMAFIWFDDSSSYHERIGAHLVESFNLPALVGLRPQDLGELLAWSLAGLVLLIVLAFCLLRRQPGDRGVLALVTVCFGLLVVFGVVTDLVHILAAPRFDLVLTVIEDGGEMIAVIAFSWIALGLARNGHHYHAMAAQGCGQIPRTAAVEN